MAKPALGRGLSALLGGVPLTQRPVSSSSAANPGGGPASEVLGSGERLQMVAIKAIRPCPFQPRKDFSPEALQELTDSIRSQGVIQPLIVRRQGEFFELIAGERRWRAAQQAELTELPVIVREATDREVLQMALIENLQRENLNPIEEALGFSELIEKFQLRQEDAAARVGKSRASVANSLRLLKLPVGVQEHVRQGRLSVGHAKVILALVSPALQEKAVARILASGLNVRQTEAVVAHLQPPGGSEIQPLPGGKSAPLDPNLLALEDQLRERMGTKVHLRYTKGRGALEIKFFSDDDLQRILDLLGVRVD